MAAVPQVGDMVVVPAEPARGVGRLERFLDGGAQARVFFYDDGTWGVFGAAEVEHAPPGRWDKEQAPRGASGSGS